jgi:hypothetical protein
VPVAAVASGLGLPAESTVDTQNLTCSGSLTGSRGFTA